MCRIVCVLFLLSSLSLASPKPIMVSFGTNQGPIVPTQPSTSRPRINAENSAPAPVFEKPDDVPNPAIYRPLIPHQYRRRIYSHRPHPNLLLGTPVDIRYTARLDKRKDLKRQIKALGIGYTGPQVFEKQDYEYELERSKNRNFTPGNSAERSRSNEEVGPRNFVPQIGIVYSSGIRYYVPQLVDNSHSEEDSNSVYDKEDSRYQDDSRSYRQYRPQQQLY